MGAYDGYKYAKKKKLKGWKKAAAIAGGAALGAVNPFKVVKAAGKLYKAAKYSKKVRRATKKLKAAGKSLKKTKTTKVKKKKAKAKTVTVKTKKVKKTTAKKKKTATSKCFVAGTKISTEKGFTPIEQIKPGDYVWSEDPATNEKALKKVKKIFVREKDSIIRLSINGEVIETTHEHPFYVEDRGFIAAGELKASDEVRLQSGKTGLVDYIEEIQLNEPIKVYNFEVEDFHTYYVSEQKVLVHNTCGKVSTSTKPNTSWYNEDGSPNYPPYDGVVLGTIEKVVLKEGTKLGRYGKIRNDSKYVTEVGCSPDELSLPPWTNPQEYFELIIKKDIPNVEKSQIAPWGDSPGGGTQYRLPKSIKELIDEGIIGFGD